MMRMKTFRMAMALALIAGPLMAGLTTAAYAQGGMSVVSGTVLDQMGKPYPDVEIIAKDIETGKSFNVKTDAKGHYSIAGMAGGTYSIDLKDKDKTLYQTGFKLTGGTSPIFDMNLKEIMEKEKGANAEAEAKRVEAEKAFQGLKAHYDAGLQAIDAMKAAQVELAKTPKEQKDQQAAVQQKITDAGGTAVTELTAAQQLMKADDPNRAIILSRLGEAYESMSKWQEAADTYQQSIAMKPDVAANYNNLGNDMAKLGKVDEARAA